MTVAELKGIFDAEYADSRATYDALAASGDGEEYYAFQYALSGTLSMFAATGDRQYLERVLAWVKTMMAKATIIDRDGCKNWSGKWTDSEYSPKAISHLQKDFQGSTELAYVARIILTDPALEAYKEQAKDIFDFVRDHIINKHLFKRDMLDDMQKRMRVTAPTAVNDKPILLLPILVHLKVASAAMGGADNARWDYPKILDGLANGLKDRNGVKARFEPYAGGLIWDKGLAFEAPFIGWDTAHANRMPDAIIELYRAGVVFDKSYLIGLANLFTKVIWNQSFSDPMFKNGIDGNNKTFRNREPWRNGMIFSGWVKLAEFDPQTRLVGEAVVRTLRAGRTNLSLSYNNTALGRLALAGHLARAARGGQEPPPVDVVKKYIAEIKKSLEQAILKTATIMTTQQEVAQGLRDALATVTKVGAETDGLLKKLEEAIVAQGNASPEV